MKCPVSCKWVNCISMISAKVGIKSAILSGRHKIIRKQQVELANAGLTTDRWGQIPSTGGESDPGRLEASGTNPGFVGERF